MKKRLIIVALIVINLLYPLVLKSQNPICGSSLNISSDSSNSIGINSSGGVLGKNNTVSSILSYAFGEQNSIGGYATGSFVFGGSDTVSLSQSICLGYHNAVSCMGGLAIGRYLNADGSSNTFVIGEGINAAHKLVSDKDHSLVIGFNSIHPTLTITKSPNNYSQSILERTGKVAIGNVTPQAKLHIRSDNDEDAGIILAPADTANYISYIRLWDNSHSLTVNNRGEMDLTSGQTPMRLTGSTVTLTGKVGINTDNQIEGYALAVDGGMIATKVHIQDVADWHDDVFEENYWLMPLSEVKAFVSTNRHLPDIPSEAEVKASGIDMAEMQAALLGKIEELTLYIIRQQEEIDSLRELVTVHFGYDACGNRISRTLEFSRMDDEGKGGEQWLTELHDTFAGTDMALFPNPTQGKFRLSLTGEAPTSDVTAVLSTATGVVLEERKVSNPQEEFDLGGRPAGIYLLHLVSGDTARAWKIIKRN